jgi:hypothetical protein
MTDKPVLDLVFPSPLPPLFLYPFDPLSILINLFFRNGIQRILLSLLHYTLLIASAFGV